MPMTSDHRAAQATELLTALVAADTINPMGGDYTRNWPVERSGVEIIEQWLAPHQERLSLERQACGSRHENLIIRLEGKSDGPALLFESHLDTVPADDWAERALQPTVRDGELIGRGACDDKGSMTAMVLALAEVAAQPEPPSRPIVLVCAGDEEFAQSGIRHFVKQSAESFALGVFGEPTQLHPVIQHQGTIRWDLTVHGESAHTSRPDLGRNAILGMMEVVAALEAYQRQLQKDWPNPYIKGPLVTVTMIQGGRTRNATPDSCTVAVDFRTAPRMDPTVAKQELMDYLDREVFWEISHEANQLTMPGLSTDPDCSLCQESLAICRNVAGDHIEFRGEPYGTDAAWIEGRYPAIVLGPGDIAYAHAVDEKIAIRDVVRAIEIYRRMMQELGD